MASGEGRPGSGEIDPATQFPLLYEREYESVFRTVRAMVLDQAEAEDLTQEVFARAYHARLRYRPTAPPGAWLHRIAVNTALSHLRRRKLARLLPVRLYQAPDDRAYARSEARTVIDRALATLSPKLRAAVVLHYFHDYSREEIAAILGIPSGTVASRIAKAVAMMRRALEEAPPGGGAAGREPNSAPVGYEQ
ncbi:MAG TPA: sigma-70 family RNA polymerase sigma factor [Candidatus Dormibacteraeota bacterium]|nr:sigma-70 family RNA polymerase sigma factor [Candidatus Dormibacteraeota bacterium]